MARRRRRRPHRQVVARMGVSYRHRPHHWRGMAGRATMRGPWRANGRGYAGAERRHHRGRHDNAFNVQVGMQVGNE